jgi:GNAT superfamily N-acetyltransferase
MKAIHAWLKDHALRKVHGTFLCNWNLTEKVHRRGELLVYIDPESAQPVAYQWGGLVSPGILEVREDMRGQGIGKVLVEHRMALAAIAGEDILYIQCKPSSSIPFWQRMGFQLLADRSHGDYAYRFMPRTLQLPDDGLPAQVVVEWLPERARYEPETKPVLVQRMQGKRVGNEVFLAERALFLDKIDGEDSVARISVDGEVWYFNKVKYPLAEIAGVRRGANGFYVDSLRKG